MIYWLIMDQIDHITICTIQGDINLLGENLIKLPLCESPVIVDWCTRAAVTCRTTRQVFALATMGAFL